jgi:hypothetical protein
MKTRTAYILTALPTLLAAALATQAQYAYRELDDPLASPIGSSDESIEGTNIVGYYHDSGAFVHGFMFDGNTWTTLDDPLAAGVTVVEGISGTNIVGYYWDTSTQAHGFLYNGSTYTTLDNPKAVGAYDQGTVAWGIFGTNVVGWYSDSSGTEHGFLYNVVTANWTTLDDPAGPRGTQLHAISSIYIVGLSVGSSGKLHGCLYSLSTRTWSPFDHPLGVNGTACQGVSGANIVGAYTDSGGNVHGFLYHRNTWTTLDDPLAPIGHYPTGGTFPRGISGNHIVGTYYDTSQNIHGFLATPTPRLAIANSGSGLNVSWPYDPLYALMAWTLEQNPDLSTTNWAPSSGVSNDGTNNFITVPWATGSLFFRLRQQ